jgi:hypothetical protein
MKYENIKLGDVAELTHLLTREDVRQFVALGGDYSRLHTHPGFAAGTNFKKPVAMTDTDQIADVPARIRMVEAANTPLRRLASVEDVARLLVFLVPDQSDFLCGETIRLNGGQVIV